MDRHGWRVFTSDFVAQSPRMIYKALPAVLLGVILNIVDAVSTGLLVFPPIKAFGALQVQAMSMYIMSTLMSQIALTFGGSLFPGMLGSMLIEVLPFLRRIATSIRDALGDDNPALLPTVMAAYTMTSFLIGLSFTVLGLLKSGRVVAYFPRTVLTGAIGAIGLSLFVLGLELSLPPESGPLTLKSARFLLFSHSHLGIFVASVLPAAFLSISTHSSLIERLSRGATRHALYVPAYLLFTAATFWITVAALGHANAEGMKMLARRGWLFAIDESTQNQHGLGRAWIYWTLFDLNNIQWHAMKGAVVDIVLLVVIGVLNLPLFIPMLAFALDVPSYNMDREFLGHGAANILAGAVGTLPNLVVFSNSVFFTRASGGRFEASLVILLTLVLFFVSSKLLPYIPTVLSCALVVFLGLELMVEAVWDSAKTLLWSEWLVVMSTLLACTFLEFAPGIGVGLGTAIVVHFAWVVVDARVRVIEWGNAMKAYGRTNESNDPVLSLTFQPSGVTLCSEDDTPQILPRIGFLKLTGYVFFAVIPSLETEMSRMASSPAGYAFVIIDFTHVNRVETTVTQFFERKFRQMASHIKPTVVVLAGIQRGSGVVSDFDRAGIKLMFSSDANMLNSEGIMTFEKASDAVRWCKRRCSINDSEETVNHLPSSRDSSRHDHQLQDEEVLEEFATLFTSAMTPLGPLFFSPRALHGSHIIDDVAGWLKTSDGVIRRYAVGQTILERGDAIYSVMFIVSGCVSLDDTPDGAISLRPSVSQRIRSLPRTLSRSVFAYGRMAFLRFAPPVVTVQSRQKQSTSQTLFAGDWFGPGVRGAEDVHATVWNASERVVVTGLEPLVTVEIPWKSRSKTRQSVGRIGRAYYEEPSQSPC